MHEFKDWSKIKEMFPNRSLASLQNRARRIGVLIRPNWTQEENERYVQALKVHGRDNKAIAGHVQTKSAL